MGFFVAVLFCIFFPTFLSNNLVLASTGCPGPQAQNQGRIMVLLDL